MSKGLAEFCARGRGMRFHCFPPRRAPGDVFFYPHAGRRSHLLYAAENASREERATECRMAVSNVYGRAGICQAVWRRLWAGRGCSAGGGAALLSDCRCMIPCPSRRAAALRLCRFFDSLEAAHWAAFLTPLRGLSGIEPAYCAAAQYAGLQC